MATDKLTAKQWIDLRDWAAARGMGYRWALELANDGRIRVGAALGARRLAAGWIVREDATYTPRPPGPPKGRKVKRFLPPWNEPLPKMGID